MVVVVVCGCLMMKRVGYQLFSLVERNCRLT